MIIKRLSDDRTARDAQIKLYSQHLRKQYQDRVIYWQSRSCSRLRSILPWGGFNLTVILDGVDHSKFRYPRSAIFRSKEFSTMSRPAMDVHGVLAHGHGAYLALSEPFTPKDSSWCCELLLHTLHRMRTIRSLDLRLFELCVQSDNTSREYKNNTVLRAIGLLTGLHKIKRGELRCLMTAHSHEDVDAFFVKSRARAAVSLFHLEPKQSSVQPCWLAHALFGFQRNFCSRILPQHCLTMEYAQKHAKQSPGAQNCSKQQQVKSHSSYQPQTSYSERSGGLTE